MKAVLVLLFCTLIFSVLSFAQAEDTQVVLALKHQNVKAAEDLLFNEISNNLHSNYGKYLSQKRIGELFGPSDEAFAFVYEWASSIGARDIEVSPSNDWITFYVSEESAKAPLKEEKLFETSQSSLNAYLDIFRVFYKGTLPRVSTKTSSEKSWMDFSILQNIESEITQEKVIPHFSTFRTSSNSVHFVVIPQFVTKQQIKLYNHPTAISQITIASSSPRNRAVRTELQFQPNEESVFQCVKCNSISKSTLFEAIQMNQYCSSLHPSQLICFSKAIEVEDLLPFAAQKISKKSEILLTFSVKLSFFDEIETPFVTLNNEIENRNDLSTISIRFAAPQMDPNTQRSIYGISSTLVGTNANNKQMVWGTGSYGISLTDMASFYTDFDVDSTTSHVQVLGEAGDPTGSNWVEATLDAQYISSIAPQVLTTCFNTDNNTNAEASTGFGDALLYFALGMTFDPSPPLIISMSLGSLSYDSCNILCTQVEQLGVATYDYCTNFVQNQYQTCMYSSANLVSRINEEFMLMGLRGISLFGAAGDGGNHFSFGAFIAIGENATLAKTLNQVSCNYSMPTFPAASPYVTAVGGLQMQPSNTSGEYYPIGCSSQTGGDITGGCGFSWQFAMPSYQQSFVQNYLNSLPAGTPLGLYNATGRAYPDFSGIASEVPIVCNGKTEIVYGTSCSTPEVAGLFSLINDHRLNNNLPSLGFINTRLYQSAATQESSMFVDATEGISSCGTDICCNNGFPAAVGWDSFTGFGNPSFSGLLSVFGSD